PFSAVDPIVRAQLQDEFLRIQRDEGKTIVLVTHDIDEALKLGDQVAVMRAGGKLAQIATPRELLTAPADEFVADFVGRDRGYRSLGFLGGGPGLGVIAEPTVRLGATRAEAEAATDDDWLLVVDADRRPLGWVDLRRLTGEVTASDLNLAGTVAAGGGTLRQILDAALSAPSRRGVIVDADGAVGGSVTAAAVVAAIPELHAEAVRP
ncbi:MAG: hypothetical protein LBD70_01980, partial [Bifidobacteriaceae bacterium]|nr:hypothetical protein [Bifidobacteriaceae bacterium]